jgi:hypothetical protein
VGFGGSATADAPHKYPHRNTAPVVVRRPVFQTSIHVPLPDGDT